MTYDLYEYETKLTAAGYKHIAGTDEVGRGPMAGPLVAAAVVLPPGYRLEGLNDSKLLSPKQRDRFYDILIRDAVEYHVAFIEVPEVDRLNVYAASKLAMTRCIEAFQIPVDFILTDAMKLEVGTPFIELIHGDQRSSSIAAASVIAKVTRDRFMVEMDAVYPEYGFKKHKGYVTKFHCERLDKYGPCPLHRRSFAPVANCLAGIHRCPDR
ncbi:MAG TPA: ribonuclease HII [Acholeplasmatales bacterium]|nr:ribonuclease HII [Acholeplasmatales bacterium]